MLSGRWKWTFAEVVIKYKIITEYELLPEMTHKATTCSVGKTVYCRFRRRKYLQLTPPILSGCQGFFSEKQWSSGCSYILPCTEKEGSGLGIVQVGRTDMILHMMYKCTHVHIQSSPYFPPPLKNISHVRLLKTYDSSFLVLFLSPGLRRMPKWQTFSGTTSARTGGGKPHWKMLFLCWESSASSILQPSSF